MKEKVSLKCLNPQGVFEIQEPAVPSPRVKNLEGKTVGIFWDGKAGGDNFCKAVEDLLKKRLPKSKIMMAEWNDIAAAEKLKRDIDTFVLALGDSGAGGWMWARVAIELEKSGKPGLALLNNFCRWMP